MAITKLSIAAHIWDPRGQRRKVRSSRPAWSTYRVSSRTPRATQRNPVSKKTKKKEMCESRLERWLSG